MGQSAVRGSDSPTGILISQFFGSLFETDLFSIRERLGTLIAGILSLLAAFGLVVPIVFNHKYYLLNALPTGSVYQEAALADKLMFISFSFVVNILVTSLQWQSLFPSVQDCLILCPLPLRRRQIFGAKFVALLLFMALLNIGINTFPAIMMPGIVMSGRWQRPLGSSLHFWSFFFSCSFAGLFAFFALVTLQAVLINVVPGRWLAKFSLIVQASLLLLSISILPLLFWVPSLHGYLHSQWHSGALGVPPAWFLGWEEEMLGIADPAGHALALRGKLALGLAILGSFASYAITYFRSSQHLIPAGSRHGNSIWHRLSSDALHCSVVDIREMAVISFVIKTLLRSRIHKILLCAIVGLGVSLSFDSFSSLWIAHFIYGQAIRRPAFEGAMLSTPLVVSFFMLCGLRFIFLLPIENGANWIFRISAVSNNQYVVSATEKTLLLLSLPPILLVTFVGFSVQLGLGPAFIRTAFVLAMGLILSEGLLWNWDRVPFACPYLPGRHNLIQTLLLYAIALSCFAYNASIVEMQALVSLPRSLLLISILLVTFLYMRIHRQQVSSQGILLKFDDLPEPEVQTLQLQPH